jgi:hypothetical protein
MEKTAIDQPGVFFATCARVIGPEVKLTIEQQLTGNPEIAAHAFECSLGSGSGFGAIQGPRRECGEPLQ